MKRLLLATAALAGLSALAPAAHAQTAFDGFYAGVGLGDELLNSRLSLSRTLAPTGERPITLNDRATNNTHNFQGRVFAGYNMTFDRWLVGGEVSWRPSFNNENGVTMALSGERVSFRSSMGAFGATVRAGYLARPDLLFYGFAGWRGEETRTTISLTGVPDIRDSGFRHGLVAGLGVEYALSNAWFIRGEFEYAHTGAQKLAWRASGPGISISNQLRSEPERFAFTVGLGYRF